MGLGCMENRDSLTRAEKKVIYKKVWESLRNRRENWGPLLDNTTIQNQKAGLYLKVWELDGRTWITVLELKQHRSLVSEPVIQRFRDLFGYKVKIADFMHDLRHKTNCWQVDFIEEAMKKDQKEVTPASDEKKSLPPSITDQFTKTRELVVSK